MATVSASLRMFDQMTQPLMRTTNALNTTSTSMDRMANSANQNINLESSLNNIYKATEKTNTILTELSNSQNNAANGQNRLNDSFNRGSSSAGGLINKVKGLIGTYLGFQVAKKGIEATIGGAMGLQQQLFTIQGIMGNKDVGEAYFNNLQKKANESVFAFEDFANNARKFMQFTKNTKSLDKLANLSERLTLMDPTQGLEGAGFALKEIMSGDGVSLKERFGFGKVEIEILKASRGMDDFISKFDKLLNKKGFTEGMLQQYNASAVAQFDNLKSNFKTALSEAGNGALEILAPVITKINQTFSNGGFQGFFNGISNGLAIIVNISLKVVDVFQWIGNVVTNNWNVICPILTFVVGALLGLLIQKLWIIVGALWAQLPALIANGIAWLALHLPIMIIVGAIFLFIYILMESGVTAEQITGFIGGVFGVLYATIYNIVATLWNTFASFGEFIGNLFTDPVYAVKKLFYDLAMSALEWIGSAAKGLTDLVNKIPGVKVDLHSGIDNLKSALKSIEPTTDKDVFKIERMDQIDYKASAQNGFKKGANITKNISNIFNKFSTPKKSNVPENTKLPNLDAWNKTQGPGNLSNGVGGLDKGLKDANKNLKNINDKIDVSNEHLELMRDLAEEKSISNFTTLTPTVNIQTGDIKEEADINKIISKIETYMEEELLNSAEGVYA